MIITIEIEDGKQVSLRTDKGILSAQPAEQPSETCKWKRDGVFFAKSPHNDWAWRMEGINYCPTCGLKIEVTE